jgi:hypothetical protein
MLALHTSSKDISVEGTMLKAYLFDKEGNGCYKEVDLNLLLGNEEGKFTWFGCGKFPSHQVGFTTLYQRPALFTRLPLSVAASFLFDSLSSKIDM